MTSSPRGHVIHAVALGAIFANAPIEPTCVEVQVMLVHFEAVSLLPQARHDQCPAGGRHRLPYGSRPTGFIRG